MTVDKKTYLKTAMQNEPKTPLLINLLYSFLFGGGICAVGEVIYLALSAVVKDDSARMLVSFTFICLSALITAFGLFDRLVKIGGAGLLIPITGFSNAMISSAIEFRSEGLVLGVGVKIFTVAGPVIVYGTAASVLYGIFYALMKGIIVLL